MKKELYTTIGIVVLLSVIGLNARAQNSNARLSAKIPFAFNVGNTAFPAGEYEVTCTNPASSAKILEFRQKGGNARVLIQTSDIFGRVQESAKLVFHRYGDRYFLSQAWMPAENSGLVVPKSREEKNTERRLSGVKMSTAAVAMK